MVKTKIKTKSTEDLITISTSNEKIGKIPSFSLPAIKTCPGRTKWCAKACYALRIERLYKLAKASYNKNLIASKRSNFVSVMNEKLQKLSNKGITSFRWHVSGDISGIKYIYDWVKIVKANPSITFFGYTHSWSEVELLPHIGILRSQPNVVLFASVDASTVKNPPKTWRVAYAGKKEDNPFPKMVECLEQVGKITSCEKCKLCFNHKSTVNIHFKVH